MNTVADVFYEFYRQGYSGKILPGEVIQILSRVLKISPAEILINFDRKLSPQQRWQLNKVRSGICQGVPLDYLFGETEFMGIKLKIIPGVFIPRPETELLVEEVMKDCQSREEKKIRILDIGTGTGNIAIALAKFLSGTNIWAIEKSPVARAVARQNIFVNRLTERIKLLPLDIEKSGKKLPTRYFDLIVSNPPYVESSYVKKNKFEPSLALDGGRDGLQFYYCLAELALRILKVGGKIYLEIGDRQGKAVKKIFQKAGFSRVKIIADYNGLDRIAVVKG